MNVCVNQRSLFNGSSHVHMRTHSLRLSASAEINNTHTHTHRSGSPLAENQLLRLSPWRLFTGYLQRWGGWDLCSGCTGPSGPHVSESWYRTSATRVLTAAGSSGSVGGGAEGHIRLGSQKPQLHSDLNHPSSWSKPERPTAWGPIAARFAFYCGPPAQKKCY